MSSSDGSSSSGLDERPSERHGKGFEPPHGYRAVPLSDAFAAPTADEELWILRLPPDVAPKHVAALDLDHSLLPDSGTVRLGSLKLKKMTYDVYVDTLAPGSDSNDVTPLIPSAGKLKVARDPVRRILYLRQPQVVPEPPRPLESAPDEPLRAYTGRNQVYGAETKGFSYDPVDLDQEPPKAKERADRKPKKARR